MVNINEDFINVFFDGVMAYLKHIPDMEAEVGTPYLIENDNPVAFDVTGIISISGTHKGCVYFTAPRVFLSHVLALMGEINRSKENLLDLSGEIANTISGNARASFGKDFNVSVPVVVEGELNNIHLPKGMRSFAIPIIWRKYTTLLVVSLESK